MRLILGCAVLAACGSNAAVSDPVSGVVLSVDRPSYTAAPADAHAVQHEFRIVATVRNTGSATVNLARCGPDPVPLHAVQSVTGERSAYDPILSCPAALEGIAIGPGETRTDALLIRGPWAREGGTGLPLGIFEGQFRLVYYVAGAYSSDVPVVERNSAVSGTFTVSLVH